MSTTKLEAVNELLDAIGEDPVSSLSSGLDDAEAAERILDRISKRVQKTGWHCNTDEELTLVRDLDGNISVPQNTLKIDTVGLSRCINVVMKGDRLYDVKNKTFTFDQSLICRVVYELDFEELTSALQDYITAIAAREFQASVMGSRVARHVHLPHNRRGLGGGPTRGSRERRHERPRQHFVSQGHPAELSHREGLLMGVLVEQTLPSLFNGVSRQPHQVRLPNQFEDATDALFSVVTGGFEKRPASINVAPLGLDTTKAWKVHIGERTVDDRYAFCVNEDGDIRIFDIDTGAEQTVNAYGTSLRDYLLAGSDVESLEIVSREDYTFIVNRNVVAAMGAVDSSDYVGEVEEFEDLPGLRDYPKEGDSWRVNHGGEQADDEYWIWAVETTTGTAYDDLTGTPRLIGGPTPADPAWEGWVLRYTGSGFPAGFQIVGESRDVADIPPAMQPDPSEGDIWKIANKEIQTDDYFVRWDDTLQKWVDTADPFIANAFDETTLPHALVRNIGGDFTLQTVPWNDRLVGNDVLVPDPPFIGSTIQDVYFYKNRMGFLSDDKVTLTQSGDLFNWWPDKAEQSLDSDPIDRTGSAKTTVKFRYAIPFRKTLFATSDTGQFELSSLQALTPKNASLDYVTGYKSSSICRPVTLGDELYFTTSTQERGVVLEYFYDDNTISNTASEITKHVGSYVEPDITKMATDPTTETLWCLSSAKPNGLYTYVTYWDGDKKVQSSWNFWDLKTTDIYDIEFLGTYLYAITRRGTETFIERISPVREAGVDGPSVQPSSELPNRAYRLVRQRLEHHSLDLSVPPRGRCGGCPGRWLWKPVRQEAGGLRVRRRRLHRQGRR